jgi:hypothetical protein
MNDKINLNGLILGVKFFQYKNGRKGFQLIDLKDGMSVARCTINIDTIEVNENEGIIKDYAENKGMYNALLAANFIKPYYKRTPVGFEYGLICKLNTNYVFKHVENPLIKP